MNTRSVLPFEAATAEHLDALVALEKRCFSGDQLSRRSFSRWIKQSASIIRVLVLDDQLVAYGVVLHSRGTKLARLYSLAVSPDFQKRGIAAQLIAHLEAQARAHQHLFMRLEVARSNKAAHELYLKLGYKPFGTYVDYYEDHDDAIRMQKTIYKADDTQMARSLLWYQQTTEFTCGPASLMMAMHHERPVSVPAQETEIDIWREANTVFMTSGHGGTHPFGLAVSAVKRDYAAQVLLNSREVLFIDGVRSEHKKNIMTVVHLRFLRQANELGVVIEYQDPSIAWMQKVMADGYTVLVLISTYRMDKKKAPHWVAVTHIDARCVFVHDPDVSDDQEPLDCQHVPIALEDFDKMAGFGKRKLKTAIAIKPK